MKGGRSDKDWKGRPSRQRKVKSPGATPVTHMDEKRGAKSNAPRSHETQSTSSSIAPPLHKGGKVNEIHGHDGGENKKGPSTSTSEGASQSTASWIEEKGRNARRSRPTRSGNEIGGAGESDTFSNESEKPGAVSVQGMNSTPDNEVVDNGASSTTPSPSRIDSTVQVPLAAEIAPDTDDIIAERDELRRVLEEQEREKKIPILVGAVPVEEPKPPGICKRLLLVLLAVGILAAGLGAGLGLGLRRRDSNPTDGPEQPFRDDFPSSPNSTNTVSMTPTAVPTISPAPTVSPQPTSSGCGLDMTINCLIEDDFFETCDDVIRYAREGTFIYCTFKPFKMFFRYSGDNCNDPDAGEEDFYACQDFSGGPASHTRNNGTVYIRAFDSRSGNIYHEDFVDVNSTFATNPENFIIGDEMNITIYDPKDFTDPDKIVSPENLLQSLKFDNTCSYHPCEESGSELFCQCTQEPCFPVYLTRSFGSVQLVEYINQEQGRITAYPQLDMIINTWAEGANDVTLTELNLIANVLGFLNLTEEVTNTRLAPGGDNFTVDFSFEADMLSYFRTRYTFFATVIGITDSGDECNGFHFFELIG